MARKAVKTLADVRNAYERIKVSLKSVGFDTSAFRLIPRFEGGFEVTGDPTGSLPEVFETKESAYTTLTLWSDVIAVVAGREVVPSEAVVVNASATEEPEGTTGEGSDVQEPEVPVKAPRKRAASNA